MKYLLMNKDVPLVSFEITNGLTSEKVINEKILSQQLPLWFHSISSWLENRNYAKHKDHLKKYLTEWGMDTLSGFIDVTRCLGLNDTLWVKREDSSYSWKSVSLYQNEFSDVCEKTAFDTGLHGIKLKTTSPEFVTDGSFKKFWKKESDGIYLYKFGMEGASNVGYEPYCEYYASTISKQIYNDTVDYELVSYNGKPCTRCSLFTSEKIGMISLGKVMPNHLVESCYIDDVIDFMGQYGLSEQVKKLFLIDCLTFNEDRHINNIGLLFNNDTFEIIGMAPIFDFNLSMLCHLVNMDDKAEFEEYIKPGHKLGGDYSQTGIAIAKDIAIKLGNIDLVKDTRDILNDFNSKRFNQLRQYFLTQRNRIVHQNPYIGKSSSLDSLAKM